MLQEIRERSTGWAAKIIVGLIVVVFALFGLERLGELFTGSSSKNDAATVNGKGIARQSVDQEVLRLIRAGQLPPNQQQAARGQILEQLIQRMMLSQYAAKGKMEFSDAQIDQLILSLPQFQDQKGHFSSQIFVQQLAQIGYTPDSFRDYLRRDMTIRQLQDGIGLGSFVTPSERAQLTSLNNETRSFRYILLSAKDLNAPIQASDDELQSYYQAHQQDYIRPEQVKLDYILLDKSALAKNIQISNDALQQEYQHQAEDASRRVSDIVVNIDKQRDTQAAQQRMKEIQAQLAKGESFESLAKQYSDDKASKQKGGSLGDVTPGIFGAPFDNVIKKLQPGQTSQPFEFDGALHLVRVTGINMPSFDELKGQLTERLQLQQVNSSFDSLAHELNDKSFSANDLESVAKDTHLPLQHSDWLSHNANQDIFSEPGVMDAAFSSDVLKQGYNSDVLDLGNGRQLVLRVKEHRDQQTLAFDQVRQQVEQSVIAEKTHIALAQLADARIKALGNGSAAGVKWQQADAVARDASQPAGDIIKAAFSLPRPDKGAVSYGKVSLDNGEETIIALDSVGVREDKGAEGRVMNDMRGDIAGSVSQGLLETLTKQAKIERH